MQAPSVVEADGRHAAQRADVRDRELARALLTRALFRLQRLIEHHAASCARSAASPARPRSAPARSSTAFGSVAVGIASIRAAAKRQSVRCSPERLPARDLQQRGGLRAASSCARSSGTKCADLLGRQHRIGLDRPRRAARPSTRVAALPRGAASAQAPPVGRKVVPQPYQRAGAPCRADPVSASNCACACVSWCASRVARSTAVAAPSARSRRRRRRPSAPAQPDVPNSTTRVTQNRSSPTSSS